MDIADLIAARRKERGMSQTRLAERLVELSGQSTVTKDEVSRWERGVRRPTYWLPWLAAALEVPRAELERATVRAVQPAASDHAGSDGEDADLKTRVSLAIDRPERADAATIQWLETCLAQHRSAEDALGAAPLIGVVQAQFDVVATMADASTGARLDELVSLSAQHAQFLAWMSSDLGDRAAARRWYERAHSWATEIGDANMAASTLSMRAHGAWSAGAAQQCVRLAEAAQWHDGHLTPGVQGVAAQMAARGHALAGEATRACRGLDEAQQLIERAAQAPEDEPPWMYFHGENWFTLQRGVIALHLGDYREAVDYLSAGLDALPANFHRDRAWYGTCLAQAHDAAGDHDAATSVMALVRSGPQIGSHARAVIATPPPA